MKKEDLVTRSEPSAEDKAYPLRHKLPCQGISVQDVLDIREELRAYLEKRDRGEGP